MLANDERLTSLNVTVSLFADPQTVEAFPTVEALLDGLDPGAIPNLGATIGSDDSPQAELLRALALDVRPVANPIELVDKLDVMRIDGEIAGITRALQTMDRDADEQGYSEMLQRLVALEQEKRMKRDIE
jgi:hypothetical protein